MATAGRIQTVLGPIAPESLGPTLMHEHVLCDVTAPALAAQARPEVEIRLDNVWQLNYEWGADAPGFHRLSDEALSVAELGRLREAGGAAVVELTCAGIRPSPLGLQRVAAASGVTIVMGTGWYVDSYLDDTVRGASVEALASGLIAALRTGTDGVRSGIIGEIGCSDPWTELERKTLRAAVIAQKETGASVNVHPSRCFDTVLDMLGCVRRWGGDMARTIVSHVDRTVVRDQDLDRLADTGCVIEYDFFGIETSHYPFAPIDMPNDATRLDKVRRLIAAGHLGRIVLSQDICTRGRLGGLGGHGYGHMFRNVVPLMRRKGFSQAEIDAIFVRTPRRLLTVP
ncbi:MAG: aryldialkylphosphatase [Alphaproteobacteria bacterium]|nr:aryldialkylphosphatase [Alphaproteobacteria bacterium]